MADLATLNIAHPMQLTPLLAMRDLPGTFKCTVDLSHIFYMANFAVSTGSAGGMATDAFIHGAYARIRYGFSVDYGTMALGARVIGFNDRCVIDADVFVDDGLVRIGMA
ncbi:MAG: hypothetical protein AUK32_08295 [Candidatus Aquicultor secundus]|uniref:Uncharacterized protein n=1 Tax=Candidatus Aquicultor secundus TaxID=1973895 RepID=A0A2M7TCP7_9ACTN|nr:MAG: hypothetical protein AUK32_08295 [Candidatus Aquicultor secundus]PIZ42706.1 MAG: hypothetical protein COY37_00020 [Candidatus Aquicultor secundus]